MKKVFPLQAPGKVDQRVVDSVKNEVRRYVKRERRKELPEGFSEWLFDCRIGVTAQAAAPCEIPELSGRIDEVVAAGSSEVYVEIIARPGQRPGAAPASPAGT